MGLINYVLDLIYPTHCLLCGKNIPHRIPVCDPCISSFKPEPLVSFDLLQVDRLNTVCRYSDAVRSVLKEAKFRRRKELILFLLELFSHQIDLDSEVDLILPVPLTADKQEQRGFNQAEVIASWLSDRSGHQVDTANLVRLKETKPLYGLSRHERVEELAQAFVLLEPERVKGKTILLVDDIVTTGATLINGAMLLREAGAGPITAFALARS